MARSGLVALSLLVLLPGCFDGGDSTPGNGTNPPPPNGDGETPQNATLYLIWPDPCPDNNEGTTSYEDPSNESRRVCGPGLAGQIPEEQACGRFQVHDPALRVMDGQDMGAQVITVEGPGFVTTRYVWLDDAGVLAEARGDENFLDDRSSGASTATTTASRDSQGSIWFEVYSDGGRCDGVGTGGTSQSRFWVGRDSNFDS